eukprot:6476900-Alexandrium_andersonii.AAC.1
MSASDRRSQRQSDSRTLWCVADWCQATHVDIQAAGSHCAFIVVVRCERGSRRERMAPGVPACSGACRNGASAQE